MLVCTSCHHEGPASEFASANSDQGYVCPKCGMDESGLDWFCELCRSRDHDRDEILHTSPLCFK